MSNEVVMKFFQVVNTIPELLALIEDKGIDNIVIDYFDTSDVEFYDELANDIYKLIDIVDNNCKSDILNKLIYNKTAISHIAKSAGANSDSEVVNTLINLAVKHKILLGYSLPSYITIDQLTVLADNNLCDFYYIENLPCLTADFVKKHGTKMDLGELIYHKDQEISDSAKELINNGETINV